MSTEKSTSKQSGNEESCRLSSARKGQKLEIVAVDDEHARVQAMRFGMSEGACVECITRIPAGPIVIRSGRQEIAVGRSLAQRIHVKDSTGA